MPVYVYLAVLYFTIANARCFPKRRDDYDKSRERITKRLINFPGKLSDVVRNCNTYRARVVGFIAARDNPTLIRVPFFG